MKVKLLISRAGLGFSQNSGDVIEIEDNEAGRMIEAGQAVKVETADKSVKVEKAAGKGKAKK